MADPNTSTELFLEAEETTPSTWLVWFYWAIVFTGWPSLLVTGFIVSHYFYPREVIVPELRIEKPTPEQFAAEVEKVASIKLQQHLGGLAGVLIVKDGSAQTVLHKRAAIGNKNGYQDLPDGSYPIHSYCLHEDAGYGISTTEDNQPFAVV